MNDPLHDLEKRIREAAASGKQDGGRTADAKETTGDAAPQGMRMGIAAGSELVGCIGAGALSGWLLDDYVGTRPLFLIIFLLFGVAAAFVNVWRISQGIGTAVGFSPLLKRKKNAKQGAGTKGTGL